MIVKYHEFDLVTIAFPINVRIPTRVVLVFKGADNSNDKKEVA